MKSFEFSWVGSPVDCYNPGLKQGDYIFYKSCKINGEVYSVGDFAIVNKTEGDNPKFDKVVRLLCFYESNEKWHANNRHRATVRWYDWARNLPKNANPLRIQFDTNNEVIEDFRSLEIFIPLNYIKRKCYVIFGTEDDPVYLIYENQLDKNTYFSCRYRIIHSSIEPVFSNNQSFYLNYDFSFSKDPKISPQKVGKSNSPVTKMLDHQEVTPNLKITSTPENAEEKIQRRISLERSEHTLTHKRSRVVCNLNESFDKCMDSKANSPLDNYSIVDQAVDDKSIKLKLRISEKKNHPKVILVPLKDDLMNSPVKLTADRLRDLRLTEKNDKEKYKESPVKRCRKTNANSKENIAVVVNKNELVDRRDNNEDNENEIDLRLEQEMMQSKIVEGNKYDKKNNKTPSRNNEKPETTNSRQNCVFETCKTPKSLIKRKGSTSKGYKSDSTDEDDFETTPSKKNKVTVVESKENELINKRNDSEDKKNEIEEMMQAKTVEGNKYDNKINKTPSRSSKRLGSRNFRKTCISETHKTPKFSITREDSMSKRYKSDTTDEDNFETTPTKRNKSTEGKGVIYITKENEDNENEIDLWVDEEMQNKTVEGNKYGKKNNKTPSRSNKKLESENSRQNCVSETHKTPKSSIRRKDLTSERCKSDTTDEDDFETTYGKKNNKTPSRSNKKLESENSRQNCVSETHKTPKSSIRRKDLTSKRCKSGTTDEDDYETTPSKKSKSQSTRKNIESTPVLADRLRSSNRKQTKDYEHFFSAEISPIQSDSTKVLIINITKPNHTIKVPSDLSSNSDSSEDMNLKSKSRNNLTNASPAVSQRYSTRGKQINYTEMLSSSIYQFKTKRKSVDSNTLDNESENKTPVSTPKEKTTQKTQETPRSILSKEMENLTLKSIRKSVLKNLTDNSTPKKSVSYADLSDKETSSKKHLQATSRQRKTTKISGNLTPSTPRQRKTTKISGDLTPSTPRQRKTTKLSGNLTPSMHARSNAPEQENDTLPKARLQLHVSYVPQSLPCREKEYSDIFNFLRGKLDDGIGGCMYISGVPGTGKTATVTEVIRNLQELSAKRQIPAFNYVNINGMRLSEPRQSYVEIVKQLDEKTVRWEQAQTILENKFTKSSKKANPTVLVVDELDILCTKRQDVVYNLLDWPTKSHAQLIVITIANTMDLPERLLMGRVTSRLGLTRLTFQPYSYKQLQEIITKRLIGTNIFNPDAVQLVARKVASVSGDARRALDICRRAAEIAEHEGPETLVNMKHVTDALNAMITQPKIQAIRHSSRLEKLILQSITAEVERTGVEETNFDSVFKMFGSIAAIEGFRMVSVTSALAAVTRLSFSRLLLVDQKCNNIHKKIILNVSSDDVYYALNN